MLHRQVTLRNVAFWTFALGYMALLGVAVSLHKMTLLLGLVLVPAMAISIGFVRAYPTQVLGGLIYLNLLVPVTYLPGLKAFLSVVEINPVYVYLLLVVAAAGCVGFITKASYRHAMRRWFIICGVLMMSLLASFSVSDNKYVAARLIQYWFFTAGLGFMAGFLLVRGWKQMETLLRSLSWLTILVGGYGILEYFIKRNLAYEQAFPLVSVATDLLSDRFFRVRSTIGHPVVFGAVLAMLLPLAIAYAMGTRQLGRRIVASCGVGIGLIALFLTFSRASWVAAVPGLLLLYWRSRHKRAMLVGLLMVVVLGLLSSTSFVGLAVERLSWNNVVESVSFTHRTLAYHVAVKSLENSPIIGMGLGSYADQFYRWLWNGPLDLPTPDNGYVLMVVETGIFGLISVLCAMGWIVYEAWKLQCGCKNDETLHHYALGLLGAMLAFVINAISFDAFTFYAPQLLFWTLGGVIVALGSTVAHRNQQEGVPL